MLSRWLTILIATGALAGCGGGGNDHPSTKEPVQLPQNTVASKRTAGDYYLFSFSTKEASAAEATSNYSTTFVSSVAADGATSIRIYEDQAIPGNNTILSNVRGLNRGTTIAEFDAAGHLTASRTPWGCTRTTTTPYFSVAPYSIAVGTTTQYTGTMVSDCPPSAQTQMALELKDSATITESVTVPAGTFNAIKLVRNASEKDSTSTVVTERTCWWDPGLEIEVKCVSNATKTVNATGAAISTTDSWELAGYSNQKLARKVDTVARFAGAWNGTYTGSAGGAAGQCGITVYPNGTFSGSCNGLDVAFGFSGTVNVDGALTMTSKSKYYPALSFSGKFDSTLKASGVWDSGGFGSGTWTLTRNVLPPL